MIYPLLLLIFRILPERLQEFAIWLLEPKTTVGVSVVALDEQGRVLLFQHRYDRAGAPRLPGGHLEPGETPDAALVRELSEEGGARIELGEIVHVEVSQRWPNRMTVYYAAKLLQMPQHNTAEITGWELRMTDSLPAGLREDQRIAIRKAVQQLRAKTVGVDSPRQG